MARYVHTYSILGYDKKNGVMGGAVQSHYFCVGSGVLRAEAGVGIVATQSLVNFEIGRSGLGLLALGYSPDAAMGTLLMSDESREHRQTGFLDAAGRFAVHTGSACIREAGHAIGSSCSCHANMMKRDTVPDAMKEAFENSGNDSLDRRLLAALQAAQREGGDIRGMQSAALVVVSIKKTGSPRNRQAHRPPGRRSSRAPKGAGTAPVPLQGLRVHGPGGPGDGAGRDRQSHGLLCPGRGTVEGQSGDEVLAWSYPGRSRAYRRGEGPAAAHLPGKPRLDRTDPEAAGGRACVPLRGRHRKTGLRTSRA